MCKARCGKCGNISQFRELDPKFGQIAYCDDCGDDYATIFEIEQDKKNHGRKSIKKRNTYGKTKKSKKPKKSKKLKKKKNC